MSDVNNAVWRSLDSGDVTCERGPGATSDPDRVRLKHRTMQSMKSFLLLSVALALCVSSGQSASEPSGESFKKGDKAYLKFSLYQEKNRHLTTNYRRGTLLPVNTEVEFIKSSGKTLELLVLPSNDKLTIENVKDFSGENIDGIIARTLSKTKVDLSGFTETERRNIQNGSITLGMTKEAVVKAIGYPPKHKTPSLQSNEWRYWMHRFATYAVTFKDNKVTDVTPQHDYEAPGK